IPQRAEELRRQARLADARRPEDREQVAGALGANPLPRVVERATLALAADDRSVETPLRFARDREQRERGNRLGLPLQLEAPLRCELDRVAYEADGLRAQEHLARLRSLLEPRRHV